MPDRVLIIDDDPILMMPGVDGYETCRGLKANPTTGDSPVILLTARGDPALNLRAYAAGAVACIPKPFRREALLATIDLASKQARRRPGQGASPMAAVHRWGATARRRLVPLGTR